MTIGPTPTAGPFHLRAWPIGQASPFQGDQVGSIPTARSTIKQGGDLMLAGIKPPPQYTRFSRVPLT